MAKKQEMTRWLFFAVLLLFILQVILLPAVIGVTYATRSVKPEHIITYSSGRLTWDADTETDATGSAVLSLFDSAYENVTAADGEAVVAPGTQRECIIRFMNSGSGTVRYRAVLFWKKSNDALPITVSLSGDGFSDTQNADLPEKDRDAQVIRAVSGELTGRKLQEFDILWSWSFEDSQDSVERDRYDTYFGDRAADGAPDTLEVGFYLVVEDENGTVVPDVPVTGDSSLLGVYLALMGCSGAALSALFVTGRRKRRHD